MPSVSSYTRKDRKRARVNVLRAGYSESKEDDSLGNPNLQNTLDIQETDIAGSSVLERLSQPFDEDEPTEVTHLTLHRLDLNDSSPAALSRIIDPLSLDHLTIFGGTALDFLFQKLTKVFNEAHRPENQSRQPLLRSLPICKDWLTPPILQLPQSILGSRAPSHRRQLQLAL